MSKIDLSKAKIGDKFRTRSGCILEYIGNDSYDIDDKYLLKDENGKRRNFYKYGNYITYKEDGLDLVEQVIDKPLDELIEEGTKQFRESRDAIAEENELQRKEEVLKYADILFFNQKDARIELFKYSVAIEAAEDIVKLRDKYLKEGKLF